MRKCKFLRCLVTDIGRRWHGHAQILHLAQHDYKLGSTL